MDSSLALCLGFWRWRHVFCACLHPAEGSVRAGRGLDGMICFAQAILAFYQASACGRVKATPSHVWSGCVTRCTPRTGNKLRAQQDGEAMSTQQEKKAET